MLASENYVVDRKGKKVAVMVPVREYQRLHDAAEELADIKAYDQVKKRRAIQFPLSGHFVKSKSRGRKEESNF
ncbi:MAG TPA: hypothetical protein VE978_27245 [Chitinophagales bacterium]|nr:hypothetical protein [Chitinophagales bacterium]